jgi:hypothetical protein
VTLVAALVAVFTTRTGAFGTAAWDVSVTEPVMVPRSDCARHKVAEKKKINNRDLPAITFTSCLECAFRLAGSILVAARAKERRESIAPTFLLFALKGKPNSNELPTRRFARISSLQPGLILFPRQSTALYLPATSPLPPTPALDSPYAGGTSRLMLVRYAANPKPC